MLEGESQKAVCWCFPVMCLEPTAVKSIPCINLLAFYTDTESTGIAFQRLSGKFKFSNEKALWSTDWRKNLSKDVQLCKES